MVNLGVAYKAQPNLTLAFDYQHTVYDEVHAIANSNDVDVTQCQGAGPKLLLPRWGSGVGFGWESMDVFKLGLSYDDDVKAQRDRRRELEHRLPEDGQAGSLQRLGPGTIRWHLTTGAAYQFADTDAFALSVSYMPKETFDGTSPQLTEPRPGAFTWSNGTSRSAGPTPSRVTLLG